MVRMAFHSVLCSSSALYASPLHCFLGEKLPHVASTLLHPALDLEKPLQTTARSDLCPQAGFHWFYILLIVNQNGTRVNQLNVRDEAAVPP